MTEAQEKRIKVTALIDANLVRWIDSMVEKKVFHNRSHGFERAVYVLKNHPELSKDDLRDI